MSRGKTCKKRANLPAAHVRHSPSVQVFLDLERDTTGKSIELLLRPNETLPASAAHDLRDAIKLGDEVTVTGRFEDRVLFIVSGIEVTQRWRDSHPGQQFAHKLVTYDTATPPSVKHAGASQQEDGRQLCKFDINGPGSCTRGAACPFLHADPGPACLRRGWIAERCPTPPDLSSHLVSLHNRTQLRMLSCSAWHRRQRRHQLAAGSGDPHAAGSQRKSQRAAIFALAAGHLRQRLPEPGLW